MQAGSPVTPPTTTRARRIARRRAVFAAALLVGLAWFAASCGIAIDSTAPTLTTLPQPNAGPVGGAPPPADGPSTTLAPLLLPGEAGPTTTTTWSLSLDALRNQQLKSASRVCEVIDRVAVRGATISTLGTTNSTRAPTLSRAEQARGRQEFRAFAEDIKTLRSELDKAGKADQVDPSVESAFDALDQMAASEPPDGDVRKTFASFLATYSTNVQAFLKQAVEECPGSKLKILLSVE